MLAVVLALAIIGFVVVVFCIACFFWRPGIAARVTVQFTIGFGFGIVIAGVVSKAFIDGGSAFTGSEAFSYLAYLLICGVLGGFAFARLFVRRSIRSSQS